MGSSTTVSDLGSQYRDYERSEKIYRPIAGVTYNPGSVVQNVAASLELFPDQKCVQLSATGANQQSLVGVVAETWPGFSGSIGAASYTSPSTFTNFRGTLGIETVTQGYHPAILLDQSGSGAVTVVDKLALIASRATAGYAQGASASAPAGGTAVVANAKLPASGIGSSITAAALAQAAQTDTLTGTPAAGDTLSVTIQTPYITSAPGVLQTTTWTTPPLTAAQAVSVTTAGLALLTYLNAQPSFSKYFIASQVAGVVTITVNALSAPFLINFGTGTTVANAFTIGLSGMVSNSLTFAVASTGGTISTAGAAVLAAGTGYLGTIPGYVTVGGGT
jgi:hypothetical protein